MTKNKGRQETLLYTGQSKLVDVHKRSCSSALRSPGEMNGYHLMNSNVKIWRFVSSKIQLTFLLTFYAHPNTLSPAAF